MTDAELLALYQATTWTVSAPDGPRTVRSGTLAPPALRPSALVTAWNPASLQHSLDENERADQALLGRIHALGFDPWRTLAHGTEPEWDEPGWCLPGDVRDDAVRLGRDSGQNAIVWIDAAGYVAMVCTRDGFHGARVGDVVE